MQMIRLVVGGLPDKIIAFDELPERLLKDADMRPPSGLPRFWHTMIGTHKKLVKGSKERNIDGTWLTIKDSYEEGPFFYLLDYQDVNSHKDAWRAIEDFVRVNAKEIQAVNETSLTERLDSLALPMAVDSKSELSLDPQDILDKATIKIPLHLQEKPSGIVSAKGEELPATVAAPPTTPPVPVTAEILAHTCESRGRGGRYAKPGECKRCDQLRAQKLVAA